MVAIPEPAVVHADLERQLTVRAPVLFGHLDRESLTALGPASGRLTFLQAQRLSSWPLRTPNSSLFNSLRNQST